MKTKVKMVAVIIALLLLAMLMGILVTQASASNVVWKKSCPVWADLDIIIVKDGLDRHVVCSVGDAK